jgi:hypothetical protein
MVGFHVNPLAERRYDLLWPNRRSIASRFQIVLPGIADSAFKTTCCHHRNVASICQTTTKPVHIAQSERRRRRREDFLREM